MNVKEFKEWISQFPDDTIVEVIETIDGGYNGTAVTTREFTGAEFEDYEFTDFTDNQFVKPENPWHNKRYIKFGKEG